MSGADLDTPGPLPAGTRLLHIGPHKTGTTVDVGRAAGYLRGTAGRRVRPRRAALEVPEVVEVSTARLGLAIADRVVRGGLTRARGIRG